MKTYENQRKVGGDYFRIQYVRHTNIPLNYYLVQFELDNYIIIKYSNKFRILTIEQLLEEKYACYFFIRKDIFDEDNFNLWMKWIKDNITIQYLVKPFPNFNPYEKIREIY